MNFKRNLFSIITLIASVFAVSGCIDSKTFREFSFLDPTIDLHQPVDNHEDEDHETYIKYGNYNSYKAKDKKGQEVDLGSTYDVLTNYANQHIVKAEGKRKILVLPVDFEDFTLEHLGVEKDEYIDNIKKTFFGDSNNNKYVSVAEYYNRSSYGKLQISGMVSEDFYTFPHSVKDIIEKEKKSSDVKSVYNEIVKKWIPKNFPSMDFSEYMTGNKEITIYLIYTYPTELKKNINVFWNFTFPDLPFSWSSYSCLNTISGVPDAHTLIHETGHLLGLPDYYPKNENDPDPTARIDMMDCSVGDHSGLSKMMYNWARPYYIKGSSEITINALTNYADLILINDDWNGTVFDEYYLIEFYSPTGLNNFDANVGNNKAKLPLLPGVKIYHVDARLGYFELSASVRNFVDYCDVFGKGDPSTTDKNINLAHDNSPSSTENNRPAYNLYELQLNNTSSIQNACAKDENLFHKGDSFEITGEKFNRTGSKTNYKVTVTGLNYSKATVKIESIKAE